MEISEEASERLHIEGLLGRAVRHHDDACGASHREVDRRWGLRLLSDFKKLRPGHPAWCIVHPALAHSLPSTLMRRRVTAGAKGGPDAFRT
jgi:hypothetical protein